ncbi:YciI family protein [Corynebacterium nuruki]|uniref:YciI family protein n=1 Tax=Corynebacterium nuruki TaxID=1032851 RepID=UPI0039BF5F32
MYAVILDYIRPLDEIDAALADHVTWLDAQYADGIFLASGRREPRVGGMILAANVPRDVLDAAIAADPFGVRGLATHTVYEFHPSKWAEEVDGQLRKKMS